MAATRATPGVSLRVQISFYDRGTHGEQHADAVSESWGDREQYWRLISPMWDR